jgi:putative selenium metabolism protein SsnA
MLLRQGLVATLDPPMVEAVDLRTEGGRISERSPALSPLDGEEVLDLGGRLVLPGLVNGHTHLYSALARGMPAPADAPRSFVEILERVWWRLDRALDEESVYVSALTGAIEAALSGTTLLVDHHASPSFVRGSLAVVARALQEVGLRSLLCYEVTDRNGLAGRDAALEETAAFAAASRDDVLRGMIGAHASFTLCDETLDMLARAVERTRSSLHIHVAEDAADVEDCRSRYGVSLVERLTRHGLIHSRAILAHAVHLPVEQVEAAQSRGGWIAHNARSNMNNAVGYAPTRALHRAFLGTDGMDQDVFAEARAAYLKMRDAGRADAVSATLDLLAGGHRYAAAAFGLPFGKLDAGAPADLVVLDYAAPTPISAENLGGHLLFGIDRSHVRTVIVAGRFVVRDRQVVAVDAAGAFARARPVARLLWQRMQAL